MRATAMAMLVAACLAGQASCAAPADYRRVSVASFGARPDDGKDDTEAVTRALAACVAKPGSALIFPTGRYDFHRDRRAPGGISQIVLDGASRIAIDGQGSELIFHGKTAPFLITGCRDVEVMNLTIDWDDPLYSAGIITRSDSRSFDVDLQVEHTGPDRVRIENVIEIDPRTHLPLPGGQAIGDLPGAPHRNIQPPRKIGPKTLRVTLNVDRTMTRGAYVVLVHQNYVYNAFSVNNSKRLTFTDVTVHYTPGMGWWFRRVEDVLLKRVRIEPRPKSGRIMSIPADGAHFAACKGTIRIEDSYFQGMGDDAANIHGHYLDVIRRDAGHTLWAKCKETWRWPPEVGEVMEFTDPTTLLTYATGRVRAVEYDAPTHLHRISFEQPLPKRLKAGDYVANATAVPKVRISGNRVYANRARGFVIKTRDVVVEKNTFESVSGSGVYVAVEGKFWRESIGTRDVIIRDNVFTNCNSGPSRSWGVIAVFALLEGRGHRMGAAGVHKNIVIEGNTIAGTDNCGIYVASTDGVTVRGNRISDCCRKPSRPGGAHAIYLLNSRNVSIRNNSLQRPGAGMREPIGIAKGVDRDTLKIEGNAGLGAGH